MTVMMPMSLVADVASSKNGLEETIFYKMVY